MKKIFVLMLMLLIAGSAYSLEVGETAPDFEVKTMAGEIVALKDMIANNKAVLVFWTTWCPSCRREVPKVNSFYKKNKETVSVLGINTGETRKKIEDFVEKKRISYPIASDFKNEVGKLYNVLGVPTIVVIDKDGKVLYYGHSMEEAVEKV